MIVQLIGTNSKIELFKNDINSYFLVEDLIRVGGGARFKKLNSNVRFDIPSIEDIKIKSKIFEITAIGMTFTFKII